MRRFGIIIVSALLIMMLQTIVFATPISASTKNVTVTIPNFKVTLNGQVVNNQYRQYPLIVYKDVTYFPMTYYDCRFLGLESKFDQKTGLSIKKTGVTGAYREYLSSNKNSSSYNAGIAEFAITVNGKKVDNNTQTYPLLMFRNITYFPMTWSFSVDEFGWKNKYDNQNGLEIHSTNSIVSQVKLPSADTKSSNLAFTFAKDYFYYLGQKGAIYQLQKSNLNTPKKIYQLPIYSYGDGTTYVYAGLCNENGEAMLKYHQGGATMGCDYDIQINTDGTTEEIQVGYDIVKKFGDIYISYFAGPMPGSNNLSMKRLGEEYKQIGNPDYIYGWSWRKTDNGEGGSGSTNTYLVGDDLYILAFNKKVSSDTNGIYKMNIKTNEMKRMSKQEVLSFQLEGQSLYFLNENRQLYKVSINDGTETKIPVTLDADDAWDIYRVMVFGDQIYYGTDANHNLYKLGSNVPFNSKLSGMAQKSDYLVCTFDADKDSNYRIMVFNKKGDMVFKSSDEASIDNIAIENNRIYYLENSLKRACNAALSSMN